MRTKEQARRYGQTYYAKHRDEVLASSAAYYRLNRSDVLARMAARRCGPDGERVRAADRERTAAHQQEHPEVYRSHMQKWYAKNRPRLYEKRRQLRAEMLFAYGNRCSCCGIDTEAFLTLDHTNRDGAQHRAQVHARIYDDLKKRGWPRDGYRLLCMNCNWATRTGNACPHELEQLVMLGATTAEAGYAKAGTL